MNQQDINHAIDRMTQAQKSIISLEELARSINSQISFQFDILGDVREELSEKEILRSNLTIIEDQKAKLIAEIETLTQKVFSLQNELESRPRVDNPKPEPTQSDKVIATIPFTIKDTTNQGRSAGEYAGEYAFTAVPLAESLNVKDVNQLGVGSKSQVSIPVDIRPTAYWPSGNIMWVQVVFEVGTFTSSVQYELLVYEKAQKPILYQIDAIGDTNIGDVQIRSGSRKWQVDIAGVHQEGLKGNGINATFDSKNSSNEYLREIYVEYLGPLVCYVVVEGYVDLSFSVYTDEQSKPKPAHISFRRRYQFLANSPLVICQETIRWEGSWNGNSHEKNQPEKPYGQRDPNAVLGTLWRERFTLSSSPDKVKLMDIAGKLPIFVADDNVSIEQKLRPQRLSNDKKNAYPAFYELSGVFSAERTQSTGGLLSLEVENKYVTVAIKDMHLHEPQAIRLVGNEVQLDLASNKFWLPHHSGVEVTYAIHVDNKQPDLNRIWREVNRPLRGLCQPEQYNESGGFNCVGGVMIPEGNDVVLADYDRTISYTVDNTISKMTSFGFQGLMTWGLYPRYWGEWGFNSGEIGSGISGWDELLRNASFTDYWCTSKLALEWALRSGESEWIEKLTIPAAVRMLHTQIMQAAPDDSFFYAGQAAAGYAMYRSDFNSSHQYWENLYLYYLVTGDRTVIDIVERGALKQIEYMNDKKGVVGRQPMQWMQCYLFLSHCHYAEGSRLTFGRAFDMFMKQAITNHYLEGEFQGNKEAIWTQQTNKMASIIGSPATFESHQLFSLCFYDMEMLYHFGMRTNNEPVNGIRPFDAMVNIARTIINHGIGSTSKNVETSAWLRLFNIDYDGKGKFTRFEGGIIDNQKILFPDDKGTVCTFFSRCAWMSNDKQIKQVSRDLVKLMFKQVSGRGLPFGKLIGMLMGRLSAAVAIEQMIDERD